MNNNKKIEIKNAIVWLCVSGKYLKIFDLNPELIRKIKLNKCTVIDIDNFKQQIINLIVFYEQDCLKKIINRIKDNYDLLVYFLYLLLYFDYFNYLNDKLFKSSKIFTNNSNNNENFNQKIFNQNKKKFHKLNILKTKLKKKLSNNYTKDLIKSIIKFDYNTLDNKDYQFLLQNFNQTENYINIIILWITDKLPKLDTSSNIIIDIDNYHENNLKKSINILKSKQLKIHNFFKIWSKIQTSLNLSIYKSKWDDLYQNLKIKLENYDKINIKLKSSTALFFTIDYSKIMDLINNNINVKIIK